MNIQPRSASSTPWYSHFKPCPEDANCVIDPNSVHLEDGKPIAYIKDRLENPTLRRELFDKGPFTFSVATGVLSSTAGVLANSALGPLGGALVGGIAGAAVNAWVQEGIAESRQDQAQCLRSGAIFGAVGGAVAGAVGPWGLAAGVVLGALSTPM